MRAEENVLLYLQFTKHHCTLLCFQSRSRVSVVCLSVVKKQAFFKMSQNKGLSKEQIRKVFQSVKKRGFSKTSVFEGSIKQAFLS